MKSIENITNKEIIAYLKSIERCSPYPIYRKDDIFPLILLLLQQRNIKE